MATEKEYQERIRKFQRKDLQDLWIKIKSNKTEDWEAGKAFEYLILRSFEIDGADVTWPYSVYVNNEIVEQIDGAIFHRNFTIICECKDYNDGKKKKNIDFEPIAKLRSQLLRRPAGTIGCIFSTGGFTNPALTLANYLSPQTILLWNGTEIEYCVNKNRFTQSLTQKYRKCVEHGIHDFDITIGDQL